MRHCIILFLPPLLSAILLLSAVSAVALEIEPFRTANRNPLVQGYGLPSERTPHLLPAHSWTAILTQDVASIYTSSNTSTEQLTLDGEQYRWALTGKYALTDRLELGLELPVVMQTGGFLDGLITDWHSLWGLPQGGRDSAPKNRLTYRYSKDGRQRLNVTDSSTGIGDISLLAGYRLFDQRQGDDHDAVVVRAQLKLPTGKSSSLHGTGSTDLALFLTGAMNRATEWGTLGVYGSAGGMVSSDGDLLSKQRENLIGFGAAGIGWSPADVIAFKVQMDLNTACYRDSNLDELSKTALMVTLGGTVRLSGDYLLDIGLSEDLAVATAPDVTFHLGLSARF
ncbi:MAG: DUF3187 family protein [Trichlorobacter sp.]|jgi:hypothetical protein